MKSFRFVFALLLSTLLAAVAIAQSTQRTIMIFAPHPDDEILFAGGVARSAILAADGVIVVVVTNGDVSGQTMGYRRIDESVAGTGLLGVPESNVIFLGYGDASLATVYGSPDTTVITSAAGLTQTYADRGLGGLDYHSYRTGVPGPYNRVTISGDVEAVIRSYSPDDIYVTSIWDSHPDHRAVGQFVTEALVRIRRGGGTYAPTVHDAFVSAPCQYCDPNYRWPMPAYSPQLLLPEPPFLDMTPLRWTDAEVVMVPPEMQTLDWTQNLKARAIGQYTSQVGGTDWLWSFVKQDEVFWPRSMANLALTATATASSQNTTYHQLASSAIDGFVDGYLDGLPSDYTKEWASVGQPRGAWIRLTWPVAQRVSEVHLYDRLNPNDNILAGTLTFSDGSTVPVGALASNGAPVIIRFPARSTTTLTFNITDSTGYNPGLAEFEVFGTGSGSNHAPVISAGPVATPSAILDTGSSSLSVTATDLDNDVLTYQWTATAGAITGSGPTVTFTPTLVSQVTSVAISVSITDGHGGIATGSTVVSVSPTGAVNVAPLATVTASSENVATTQLAIKAVDGVAAGYPGDYTKEWATVGQLAGAWINLVWPSAQLVSEVRLFDRPNGTDQVLAGVLEFSDGTSITVGPLPNDGTALPISLPRKSTTSVRFRITAATGVNIGLSEIMVFASSGSRPTVITAGPTATPASIAGGDTSALAVSAADPDGDPMTYNWSADVGQIVGSGALVTYQAPSVTVQTRATVTLTVTDSTGLSTSGSVSIDISPRPLVNVAPFAAVTVSSENSDTGQLGIKAIDGIIDGYPGDYTKEWATLGETAGAFLRLDWTTPQTVTEIHLFDRPNLYDNITAATLLFSDGSSINVGSLPPDGSDYRIVVPARTVTWVMLRVDAAAGRNTGLAEIQVFVQ